MHDKKKEDDRVDAGSEFSFPASDPPSYMGGTAIAGSPDRGLPREPVRRDIRDPGEAKPPAARPGRGGKP